MCISWLLLIIPSFSVPSKLAPPSSNTRTTAKWPLAAAYISGVARYWSPVVQLSLVHWNKIFTVFMYPDVAASIRYRQTCRRNRNVSKPCVVLHNERHLALCISAEVIWGRWVGHWHSAWRQNVNMAARYVERIFYVKNCKLGDDVNS